MYDSIKSTHYVGVNILKDVQEPNKECIEKLYLHKLGLIYKVFLMSALSYCQKDKNIKA